MLTICVHAVNALKVIPAEVQIHDKQAADPQFSAELKLEFNPANICRRLRTKRKLIDGAGAEDDQFTSHVRNQYCKFELDKYACY